MSPRIDSSEYSAILQELVKANLGSPWIESRMCHLGEQPKCLPIMFFVILTTSQNECAANPTLTDQLAQWTIVALTDLAEFHDPYVAVGGVWNGDRSFRNQSAITMLVRGVKINIDGR